MIQITRGLKAIAPARKPGKARKPSKASKEGRRSGELEQIGGPIDRASVGRGQDFYIELHRHAASEVANVPTGLVVRRRRKRAGQNQKAGFATMFQDATLCDPLSVISLTIRRISVIPDGLSATSKITFSGTIDR